MKKFLFFILLVSLYFTSQSQSLSEAQQKAFNNYIELVNQMTQQVYGLGPSLVSSYKRMLEFRERSRVVTPYTCAMSLSDYYNQEAQKTGAALTSAGSVFITKAETAHQAYQAIDKTCKEIEVYYRLRDYESDKFEKFETLVRVMEEQVKVYHERVKEVHTEAEKLLGKLQPYNSANAYHKADRSMRNHLVFERELLEACTFNIEEDIHTGWPGELAQKHIRDDVSKIETLRKGGAGIQYPASSMYKSFVEGMESLQSAKRNGVDGYTYDKQQSDEHSNRVYSNLINYYNNVGVSFYNNFIKQATPNGFRGVYYLYFVQVFSIRSTVKQIVIEVTPFADKPTVTLNVTPVNAPISTSVFACLSDYLEFMNEGMRQVNHMMNPIHSLNTYASYGKSRLAAGQRVNLEYYYKSYELPLTLYQKTIDQTKALPVAYQAPIKDQAEVLFSVLTELNQWNNVLLAGAASKQLTKDSMDYVYGIIERYKVLAETFDVKKEKLYRDVRSIFETYKPADAKNSWVVSGNALLALLDEDHKELHRSKKMLFGDLSLETNTTEIERQVRDLLTDEYANLAGIQKYGRNNGMCPYSPYEDLATYSKQFTETMARARQGKFSSYYRHPYNEVVSQYNQSLVANYNKFAELSKAPLLKSVLQAEVFEIVPHRPPEPKKTVAPSTAEAIVVANEPEKSKVEPVAKEEVAVKQKNRKKEPVNKNDQKVAGGVVRDTVRITDIIRIETVRQDTVYLARVDTVYVGVSGENLMSMDGYATNNLVLLLDVSGSMNSPEKFPLLKKSILLLMKMMRPEDQVSIITYSGKAKVKLPPTSFKEEQKITSVIERLKSEGKTDGNTGIRLAYQVADKNYIRGGNNRIILATDGEFGIGNPTYELVKKYAAEDIFITVFNFGKSTATSKNLQQLAGFGKGNYEYITQENADMKLIMEAKAKRKGSF